MKFKTNISLKNLLTMQVEVEAKKAVEVFSEDDLINLWKVYHHELQNVLVIGGGSNLVITKNLDQLVLLMRIESIVEEVNDPYVHLTVGAGVDWNEFVQYCLQHNYAGLENLISIPGRVGASPMQNIGAYGVEVKDVIEKVRVFNLEAGVFEWINNADCHFGYRESIFKNVAKGKYIISQVQFKLKTKEHILHFHYGDVKKHLEEMEVKEPTIQDIAKVIKDIRSSKLPDPKLLPNCGSFFKNPIIALDAFERLINVYPEAPHFKVDDQLIKVPAGWLIEKAGWKGKRIGKVGMHEKQALVLVNYENATGKEIYEFSEMVKNDILSKFGIDLEREVNFI